VPTGTGVDGTLVVGELVVDVVAGSDVAPAGASDEPAGPSPPSVVSEPQATATSEATATSAVSPIRTRRDRIDGQWRGAVTERES
jgi:hypothetical protein